MEPDLQRVEMEKMKQQLEWASTPKYHRVASFVPLVFCKFSYGSADCQNAGEEKARGSRVLNPSRSLILKDSYLPLIQFDSFPVGKSDRDPSRGREEKTGSSKRQRKADNECTYELFEDNRYFFVSKPVLQDCHVNLFARLYHCKLFTPDIQIH